MSEACPLDAAHRLMYHHAAVGECETLSLLAGHEEHGCHRSGHAGADGGYVAVDILHSVVDAETGVDRSARRIDVERDILIGIHRVEIEELCLDDVGALVAHLGAEEDDAVHHEAGEYIHLSDVELTLLEDVGVHVVGVGHCHCSGLTVYGFLVAVEHIAAHAEVMHGIFFKVCHIVKFCFK